MSKSKPRKGWRRATAMFGCHVRLTSEQIDRLCHWAQSWDPETRRRIKGVVENLGSRYLRTKASTEDAPTPDERRAALWVVRRAAARLVAALDDADELSLHALDNALGPDGWGYFVRAIARRSADELAELARRNLDALDALPARTGRPAVSPALHEFALQLARLYRATGGVFMSREEEVFETLTGRLHVLVKDTGSGSPEIASCVCAEPGVRSRFDGVEEAGSNFSFDWHGGEPASPGACFVAAAVTAVDPCISRATLGTVIRRANELLRREHEDLARLQEPAPE